MQLIISVGSKEDERLRSYIGVLLTLQDRDTINEQI